MTPSSLAERWRHRLPQHRGPQRLLSVTIREAGASDSEEERVRAAERCTFAPQASHSQEAFKHRYHLRLGDRSGAPAHWHLHIAWFHQHTICICIDSISACQPGCLVFRLPAACAYVYIGPHRQDAVLLAAAEFSVKHLLACICFWCTAISFLYLCVVCCWSLQLQDARRSG